MLKHVAFLTCSIKLYIFEVLDECCHCWMAEKMLKQIAIVTCSHNLCIFEVLHVHCHGCLA
jgi:hypothetical protein